MATQYTAATEYPVDLGYLQGMQGATLPPSVVPPESLAWGMNDNPLESWDGNLLDAFEQYLDSTPNLDHKSYGAQGTGGGMQPPASRQSSGDSHSKPELSKTMSSSERKQQNNRAAQKRFRARQKAKSQTIEVQLAETTAQLNELKMKQKQLESRNQLLEKVAALNRQPSTGSNSPSLTSSELPSWQSDADNALKGLTVESERGPQITITILDEDKVLTVKEAGDMGIREFARYYSAYARKLGGCLLEGGSDDSLAAQQLRTWTMELTSLMVCVALGNREGFKAFHQANMEDGKADVRELEESFYLKLLAAIDLTEAQQRDMMYLRRLFFGKLGQLARERKNMIGKLPTDPMSMRLCHASDKLTEMERLAEQLRANGAEEYRTYVQLSSAFYRGIQTTRQHAVSVVHSYPWIPEKGRVLEVMAASIGEPPSELLMQPNGLDDLQHAANWQQVEEYLKTVNMSNLHLHVPLLQDASSAYSSDTQLGSFTDSPFDLLI